MDVPPSTADEFQSFVQRYQQPSAKSLLVCLRGSGTIAGVVNINSIIRGRFQSGSLGYAAFAPTAGHGYMTEGLGLRPTRGRNCLPPIGALTANRDDVVHGHIAVFLAGARTPVW